MRVETGDRRVRALLGGEVVADTLRPKLVWERPYYPTLYLPEEDVRTDLLVDTGEHDSAIGPGTAQVLHVEAGGRRAPSAARRYAQSTTPELAGTVRLDWDAMDAWFEEDEQMHVHPRDPYKRVDVLQSSRQVRIEVGGVTLAESDKPRMLFETGLPYRFYLPKTDVRMGLLAPTATITRCPYKGTAQYYAVEADGERYEDYAWWYEHPALESAGVAGYVCFYDEKVDVYVDGALRERPDTPFA